ncbi:MAG: molybdopterin molybdenumtransferase MoeA [Paenibacillus sp.]|nr:molybdopterin molybdenumtransferase MoeA [Paenibacillus sp.]
MLVNSSIPRRTMITVEEAQARIAAQLGKGLPSEQVPLLGSLGRRLARDLVADQPIPHFSRSGVDGYAVRAQDTACAEPGRPAVLDVVETIACGQVPQASIGAGQAARIMTGAAVPAGADAVIMLEMTEAVVPAGSPPGTSTLVRVGKPAAPGDNVTAVGREAAAGELLLAAGTRIGAGEAAVLASLGCASVAVRKRPLVAVLATGTELLPVDTPSPLPVSGIRDSNSTMLAALAASAGADAELLRTASDRLEDVLPLVRQVMSSGDYDAIITSGGVSVGDYDVMVELFRQWDGELLFNKVQMRPGSPTSVGVWHNRLLFALSGNPSACMVGFELMVRPALLRMQGVEDPVNPGPNRFEAVWDGEIVKGTVYERYIRAKLRFEAGTVYVMPAGGNKSSDLISLSKAQCLVIVPPGGEGITPGSHVQVIGIEGCSLF